MMKFYRLEARRILAGQKKLSTILITPDRAVALSALGKIVDRKGDRENSYPARVSASCVCGKAEDGSG
jgi:hypothetical protein